MSLREAGRHSLNWEDGMGGRGGGGGRMQVSGLRVVRA